MQHQQQGGDFDWLSVFPMSRIKAQIKGSEDIGRLPKKTLELISASSALLVRDIIQESIVHAQAKKQTNPQSAEAEKSILILNSQDILKGVRERGDLSFLEDAVEQALDMEDGKLASTKVKKGQKRSRATGNQTAARPNATKKSKINSGISSESLNQALEVSSQETTTAIQSEKIVVDDEDYD
jgi:hypothetical protein